MKPKKDEWVVISGGKDFPYALVCFIDSESFYWGQSFSKCIMLDNYKIVENLGKHDSDDWDNLEIKYIKKYYPLKGSSPVQSAGWLSPDAFFYTCEYAGHRSLSRHLSAHYYECLEDTENKLEENNWIKIYKNGRIGWNYGKELKDIITKKQFDFIQDLMILDGDEEWNYNMRKNLVYFE